MEFTQSFELTTEYVSPNQKLSPSGLLRFVQDLAMRHAAMLGLGHENTREKGIAWVVARYHFEISELPSYNQTILGRTWPGKMIAYMYPRNFEFDFDGKTIIRGNSAWVLIDMESRTPINPSQKGMLLNGDLNGRELPFAGGMRSPELPNKSKLVASWSSCDLNGHINNTRYFDLCQDLMPLSLLQEKAIAGIGVAYKKEVRLGETIEVEHGLIGDTYWFKSDYFVLSLTLR